MTVDNGSANASVNAAAVAAAAKKRVWWQRPRWIIRIIFIVLVIILSNTGTFSLSSFKRGYADWVRSFQPYPLVPLILYTIFSTLFCALSPFSTAPTILAGATFEVWYAVPCVYVFMNVAAVLNFVLVRFVLRSWITARFTRDQLVPFASFDKLIAFDPIQTVAILRTMYLGAGSKNYAFSLSDISLRNYICGNLIGLFPGAILFTIVGTQIQTYIDIFSGRATPLDICVFVFVIVVVIVGVVVAIKTIKPRLQAIGARMRKIAAAARAAKRKAKAKVRKERDEEKSLDDDAQSIPPSLDAAPVQQHSSDLRSSDAIQIRSQRRTNHSSANPLQQTLLGDTANTNE